MEKGYQENFSDYISEILDKNIGVLKAKKVSAVIQDFMHRQNKPLNNLRVLDIGGSAGFVARELSPFVKKVFVIDIDEKALKFGKKNNFSKNIIYKVADAMNLPFKDESFDIAVCNHVYEHVPSSKKLVEEVYRVLKKGGICYFGAANRFLIMEPHHNLPFLSWLPKRIANIYLKLFRGEDYYYEDLLSYFRILKLCNQFKIYDYTIKVIKNTEKYFNTDIVKPDSMPTKFPKTLLKLIEPIIPSYIFVLEKMENKV